MSSRTAVSGDQRLEMIGNIKRTLLPKTGLQEKQVLQDPEYVEDVGDSCCMLYALGRIMSKRHRRY